MVNSNIKQEIIGLVLDKTGTKIQFDPLTELKKDLGLDGDEAFVFMEAFAERFNVDKGNFDFHRYFEAEGFNPLSLLLDIFKPKKKSVALTLAMLEQAATLGVWESHKAESTNQ